MGKILKSYVQKIKELPTLPSTAHQILNLTNDPLLSINELVNIVETDPAISAKILSVANSAFFACPVHTIKLNEAIMRVGLNNVKNIAFGIAVLSFLDNGNKASSYINLFNHSVHVGLTARFIAKDLKLNIAEDTLINGLLHDLGYLVLHRYFSDSFEEILKSFENSGSLLKAEKDVLSFTHADIGFWLAEQWNLPDTILDTIMYHHIPSLARRNEKQVAIIHIADYITAKITSSPIEYDPKYPFDHCSFDILAISDNDMKDMELSISNIPLSDEFSSLPLC
jgi:putative nucleotidyltransferase with HDIG domain